MSAHDPAPGATRAPAAAGAWEEPGPTGDNPDGPAVQPGRLARLGPSGFALAVAAASVGYLVEALHYGRGTSASPGPGLFPQLVSACLLVSALGTAATSLHPTDRDPARPVGAVEAGERHRVGPLAVITGAAVFVATLQTFGFFLGAVTLLVIVELGTGVRNPFRIALFAILLALASQLIFVDALGLKFFSTFHFLDGPS